MKGDHYGSHFPYSGMEQIEHYQHHLIQILAEAASYGFELAVFLVGHYPLIEHARSAVISYNQWAYDREWKRICGMAIADFQVLGQRYEAPGDHAGDGRPPICWPPIRRRWISP